MHILNDQPQRAEALAVALLLSATGGFLDIYSYLYRGHVFANAVTGNIVLFGLNLAEGDLPACGRYLLAICAYAGGVFTACLINARFSANDRHYWHQAVLGCEIAILVMVAFLPCGKLDFIANAAISFICAMQVQAFRHVRGLPFASTMCTGNLRSGSELLFKAIQSRSAADLRKALHYYGVIAVFILGALAGAILLRTYGTGMFLATPAALLAASVLIVNRRQRLWLRRHFRRRSHDR